MSAKPNEPILTISTFDDRDFEYDYQYVLNIDRGNVIQIDQVINGNAKKVDVRMATKDLLLMVYVQKTRQLQEKFPNHEILGKWVMVTPEGTKLGITKEMVMEETKKEEHVFPCVMANTQSGGYPADTVLLVRMQKEGDKKNEFRLFDFIDTEKRGVMMFKNYLEKAKKVEDGLKAESKKSDKKEEAVTA